jgi:hypothetical protein
MALPKIKFDKVSCVVDKTNLERVSQYYTHKKHAMNKCKELKKIAPTKNYVVWTYELSWPDNEDMP